MPEAKAEITDTWNVLLVEDDANVRRQVREFLSGEVLGSRRLQLEEITELSPALNLIKERKADLVILDVYKGQATPGGEKAGIQILDSIKSAGFAPVVLYTALPEGLESYTSPFVRLVGKDADGLPNLRRQIDDLFRLRVPQLFRAIGDHLDEALATYMWGFVQDNWKDFEPIAEKPEFLRLVLQRLGMTFARQGVENMVSKVYGVPPGGTGGADTIHPAEYYVKPPIGEDPLLGDIRVRIANNETSYLVVLWPSCDMVSVGGRTPKAERILCAIATRAEDTPEVRQLRASPSKRTEEEVSKLIRNVRTISPDRYHFLPGVWDIPSLVVDFQGLDHISLAEAGKLKCLGNLASPFAEALATRFHRYVSRPGTPDLDFEFILEQLRG